MIPNIWSYGKQLVLAHLVVIVVARVVAVLAQVLAPVPAQVAANLVQVLAQVPAQVAANLVQVLAQVLAPAPAVIVLAPVTIVMMKICQTLTLQQQNHR